MTVDLAAATEVATAIVRVPVASAVIAAAPADPRNAADDRAGPADGADPARDTRALSIPGDYLRATATNSPAAVHARPDFGSRVFFYCAFEMAVRRRFRPDSPIPEIARSVVNAGRRHAPVIVPGLEAEMLVRDALGEPVPIEDIPATTIVTTHVLVFASLVEELALDDDELNVLIAAAEDRAEAMGHTLAR